MGNCLLSHGGEPDSLKPKAYYYYGDSNDLGRESKISNYGTDTTYGVTGEPNITNIPAKILFNGAQGTTCGNMPSAQPMEYAYRIFDKFEPTGGGTYIPPYTRSYNTNSIEYPGTKSVTLSVSGNGPAVDSNKEGTVGFYAGSDENANHSCGNVRLVLSNRQNETDPSVPETLTTLTLAQAVQMRAIKPMVLIGNTFGAGGPTTTGAQTIFNGGSTSVSGLDGGSGCIWVVFMTNKRFRIKSMSGYDSGNEWVTAAFCETDKGRFTASNSVYVTSRYGEKYW